MDSKSENIMQSLRWTPNRIEATPFGKWIVKSAKIPPRHKFWKVWDEHKFFLKRNGYSVKKHYIDWFVTQRRREYDLEK